MRHGLCLFIAAVVLSLTLPPKSSAGDITPADRGYSFLRSHQFLPPDFDEDVLAELWTTWPEPERTRAMDLDPAGRRRMTFSYYGLIPSPDDTDGTKPALGYVKDAHANWTMNCLACHGGKVAGRVIPGLPNSHIALQTLTEDVRIIKAKQGKPFSHLDLGSLSIPLSTTNGTTNAVVFGVALGAYRKPDMTVDLQRKLPPLTHHDVDAPSFWNVKKKSSLYADGFAPKTARPLMQFIMLPKVTPADLNSWEPHFADILSWIESLEAPKYPYAIDQNLAAIGRNVFEANCAQCHGTYGPDGRYEQQVVSIEEIGTDPVRLNALTPEHRKWMQRGWLSRYGDDPVDIDPKGYVAPPLDGIWASAPYLHNGSVPTLWHILHPEERPRVWKRTEDGYDTNRVGLEIETFDKVPASAKLPAHRRRYFDTNLFGKSEKGHDFPSRLTEEQKSSVLEYLKTL